MALAIRSRILAAALGILCFSSSSRAQGTNSDPIVLIRGFKGSPSALKGNRWLAVQVGDIVVAGGKVRTGANDSLDLQLDEPGRVLSLSASSLAMIDLRIATVSLETGEAVASIRRTRRQNTSVILRAPFGVCTVRAADFRVTINPIPAVAVLDGLVEFVPARANAPGAVMLRDHQVLIANIENPSLQIMDPQMRSFLIGRVDSLVTFHGSAAEKFRSRVNLTSCHTPPLPKYADPEAVAGRTQGFVSVLEDDRARFAPLVEETSQGIRFPTGSAGCPIHGRLTQAKKGSGEAPRPVKRPWEE